MTDITDIARRLRAVSDTPLLDARRLLSYAGQDLMLLEACITRRLRHEPVSKITGRKGFWKADFITSADVLDPRPDSETIIAAVLKYRPDTRQPFRMLDIGTGSGCLLASLLGEYPNATGVAVDKSSKALSVARQNLQGFPAVVRQADFFTTDWTSGLGQFDVIVSNPPYIPTAEIATLSPDIRDYDPLLALDGGGDGMAAYARLAQTMMPILIPTGQVFLEIGQGQSAMIQDLFQSAGWIFSGCEKDFGGVDRVLIFEKKHKK